MTDQQQQQHPITPPPELVQEWLGEFYGSATAPGESTLHVATRADQWGAGQELEACCEWLREAKNHGFGYEFGAELARKLRAARRPKPPSLKEQAWKLLECYGTSGVKLTADQCNTIRRALEALPND